MKFHSAIVVAVISLAGATDAFAQYGYRRPREQGSSGGLGARYRSWTGKLGGDIEATDAGLGGSTINVDSTLGLGEGERINDISLWLPNLPMIGQLNVQYWWGEFEGSRSLTSGERFAGTDFAVGSTVNAGMGWDVWTFLWESGPSSGAVPGTDIASWLSGQIGFRHVTIEVDMADSTRSADGSIDAWIPVVGMRARMSLAIITLEGEAVGAKAIGIGGIDGWTYDFAVSANLRLSSFFAGAGYRWFTIDVKDSSARQTDEMTLEDLRVEGWFFEGGLRF